MKSTGSACNLLLLLTISALSSARNARYYFQAERFQNSPSRPEDALVFFAANVPPLVCEPHNGECDGRNTSNAFFCLALPRGYSYYRCSFEGSAPADTYLKVIRESLPHLFSSRNGWLRLFSETKMYCTSSSQLPDEYFQLKVQRPHEDRTVKCRLLNDSARLYVRFPGYPTVVCYVGPDAGRYRFNLPGIDDQLKCAFRAYSELLLGDSQTERRLHESLVNGLPRRMDAGRPRLECSRRAAASNVTADFELLLQGGQTYDCRFPDAAARYPLEGPSLQSPTSAVMDSEPRRDNEGSSDTS